MTLYSNAGNYLNIIHNQFYCFIYDKYNQYTQQYQGKAPGIKL